MKIIDRGKVKRDENGPSEHPTAKNGAETSERRIGIYPKQVHSHGYIYGLFVSQQALTFHHLMGYFCHLMFCDSLLPHL